MDIYLELLKNKSFEMGVDFLTHDGNSFGRTTNNEWNDIIEKNKLHEELKLHYRKELSQVINDNYKYFLKSDSSANTPFLKKLSEVGMCNSVAIYRKNDKRINAYFFTAPKFFPDATQIFFNKIEIFEKIVDVVEKTNISDNNNDFSQLILGAQDFVWFKKNKSLVRYSGSTKLNIKDRTIILTEAELKLFKHLIYTTVTKEISAILGISTKTVDWHIDNIKKKTGIIRVLSHLLFCSNKFVIM